MYSANYALYSVQCTQWTVSIFISTSKLVIVKCFTLIISNLRTSKCTPTSIVYEVPIIVLRTVYVVHGRTMYDVQLLPIVTMYLVIFIRCLYTNFHK